MMILNESMWDYDYKGDGLDYEDDPYGFSSPPKRLAADWIEVAYLTVIFFASAPINTAAFSWLNETPTNFRRSVRRLETLKRHLNYSDLMLTFIYIPVRVCWNVTYQWKGGNFLCKLVRFAYNLSFQSSSNMIVCISLDRVLSILAPSSAMNSARDDHRCKLMIGIAWVIAILLSVPAFFAYSVFSITEEHKNWEQCISIWEHERMNLFTQKYNEILNHVAETGMLDFNVTMEHMRVLHAKSTMEFAYGIVHLIAVFFLPLLIIVSCYAFVVFYINGLRNNLDTVSLSKSKSNTQTTSLRSDRQTETTMSLIRLKLKAKRLSGAGLSLLSSKRRRISIPTRWSTVDSFKNWFLNKRSLRKNESRLLVEELSKSNPTTTIEEESVFQSCPSQLNSVYKTVVPEPEYLSLSPLKQLGMERSSSVPSIVAECKSSQMMFVKFNARGSLCDLQNIETEKVDEQGSHSPKASIVEPRRSSVYIHKNVHKVRRNTLRVSGLLVSAYVFCWLPYNIIMICCLIYPHLMDSYKRSLYIIKDLVALNAVINPFLYGMFGSLKRFIRTG